MKILQKIPSKNSAENIIFTQDKKHIILTSRGFGIEIIDMSDFPEKDVKTIATLYTGGAESVCLNP